MDYNRITRTVSEAIADTNDLLPDGDVLSNESGAPIAAVLDSLGTVNLLLALESRLDAAFGVQVSLIDALEAEPDSSPLRTLTTLTEFVTERLREKMS